MGFQTRAHYDELLGPRYAWMVGDFFAAVQSAGEFFDRFNADALQGQIVDLGCGHGVHAVALARRGASVLAIDQCQFLLDQLLERSSDLDVVTQCDDLLNFEQHLSGPADAILCLGDTLTHLESEQQIHTLVTTAANNLTTSGWIIVSFRNYFDVELSGNERFIFVRGDDSALLTCQLDYLDDKVRVTDLLHERIGEEWKLAVSSYEKVRLSPDALVEMVEGQGLALRHRSVWEGMVNLAFQRTDQKAAE